ncbi:isochorismatase family protein [Thorsellia anophelis]|uniref:Nicotinamidase-related amidase n=1 Tax=Thorsellia anophelis DSM 18579 TaxID=1123402 RepID=A0A1I0CJS9_9GAMM|nr:isochorismatase family protein [Thorsellia anophelis]SET19429.1 Nicotinamidase-related amidase [Thorsellia anophelis DSM 18579]
MKKTAFILIDLQNDYLEGGLFPLYNTKAVIEQNLKVIDFAKQTQNEVVHIQHVADPAMGIAPFFNEGSEGVKITNDILSAAPDSKIIIKHFADSFEQTELDNWLKENKIERIVLSGMMTQNCVTHTALSKHAEKYEIVVLSDACTTVSEILHLIALHAISPRVKIETLDSFIAQES